MFKVKVFISHKPIGWLRLLAGEVVVSPSLARATKCGSAAAGDIMERFEGPEAETCKTSKPVVTFQLVRI